MSAAVSVDLTETLIFVVLRNVLKTILPSDVEIVRAEINRVPEPIGPNFVLMTPLDRRRLATNYATWQDGALATPQVPGTRMDMQPTQITVQLDVHGPTSADNTQIITTLFRSEVAFDAFAASGYAIQVLYADDPHQAPFINDQQQFEYRWVVGVQLQASLIVTSPQQFADVLSVGLVDLP